MKFLYSVVLVMLLSSCSGDSSDSSDQHSVYVYDTDLVRSCDHPENETLQQSAQALISEGVDVITSSCGEITGVAWPEVCGSPTGRINVHLIHRNNLVDAEPLGYKSVDRIDEVATSDGAGEQSEVGYELTECRDDE